MLSIDDLKRDAETFRTMLAEKSQETLMMQGALNYIESCVKFLEGKEMEEGYQEVPDNEE